MPRLHQAPLHTLGPALPNASALPNRPAARPAPLRTNPQAQGGTKVACFDFDGTLVGIKSGAKWPKDESEFA